jgi:hypothetical protein
VRSLAFLRPARGGRLAIAVTALSSAAALAAALAAGPAGSASAAVAVPARAVAVRPAAGALFLLNGDQVITAAGPGGRPAGVLRPVPGTGAVITLGLGQQRYDIPADALPFVGHGLSPGLFSLTSLRRAETGGRLPVRVSYAGRRPVLPGITITSSGTGTASGYLTAVSARLFGAALGRQFRADHGRASYGRDGMFAAGTTVTVPGARTWPARVRPDFPMHTLTVRGTDLAGRPDTGDQVEVLNAANWHTFGDPIESLSVFYHGVARFSVPAGTYWAIGFFGTVTPRMVVLPQFTVTGQHTTVSLAESLARKVMMRTPRPSVPQTTSVLVVRGGRDGTSSTVLLSGTTAWISPTHARPTVGTLRAYASAQQVSPSGARGAPYQYLLAPASAPGRIPDPRWVIRPASLATATNRYFQASSGAGQVLGWGGSLVQWQNGVGGLLLPLRLPGTLTQYVTGGRSVVWDDAVYPQSRLAGYGQYGLLSPRPGARLTVNWGQYPLHPQPAAQPLTGAAARLLWEPPSAYRIGNTLVLRVDPFSDNTAGHLAPDQAGEPGVSGRYAVYQNGTEIARGNPFTPSGPHSGGGPASGAGTTVQLTARPSVIRLVMSVSRRVTSPLSDTATTVWTWRSRRNHRARVPNGWFCQAREFGPLVRTCAVQPMLALDYHVRGMALDGLTAPGRQVIGLDAGPIPPGGRAGVTAVTVRVSADGGRAWRPAVIRPAGTGRFTVTFAGRADTEITLRVAARDAAGGSITETIRDAYGVRS